MRRTTRGKVGRPKGGTMTKEHKRKISRAMKRSHAARRQEKFEGAKQMPLFLEEPLVFTGAHDEPRSVNLVLHDMIDTVMKMQVLHGEFNDLLAKALESFGGR